jgi:hypothetical protein
VAGDEPFLDVGGDLRHYQRQRFPLSEWVGSVGLEPTTRGLKERPSPHSLASPGSRTSADDPTRALVHLQWTPFRVTIDVTWARHQACALRSAALTDDRVGMIEAGEAYFAAGFVWRVSDFVTVSSGVLLGRPYAARKVS